MWTFCEDAFEFREARMVVGLRGPDDMIKEGSSMLKMNRTITSSTETPILKIC